MFLCLGSAIGWLATICRLVSVPLNCVDGSAPKRVNKNKAPAVYHHRQGRRPNCRSPMKRNQDRVRKNASHPATHSQVKITQTKASSAAAAQNRKPLTFSFTGESGAEVIRLSLDERYACLLKRVSEATGLAWCDLLNFILDRQLEAFFPDGDRDVFSVRLDATSKITEGFSPTSRIGPRCRKSF